VLILVAECSQRVLHHGPAARAWHTRAPLPSMRARAARRDHGGGCCAPGGGGGGRGDSPTLVAGKAAVPNVLQLLHEGHVPGCAGSVCTQWHWACRPRLSAGQAVAGAPGVRRAQVASGGGRGTACQHEAPAARPNGPPCCDGAAPLASRSTLESRGAARRPRASTSRCRRRCRVGGDSGAGTVRAVGARARERKGRVCRSSVCVCVCVGGEVGLNHGDMGVV